LSGLIYGCDDQVKNWVKERIDFIPNIDFGPSTAIGVATDSKLIAGVVYHEYQKNFRTIQLSMAADSPIWAKKRNIAGLLGYPFIHLNVFKAWIATPLKSRHALKTFFHVGFKQEAVLGSEFGPGNHCVRAKMELPVYKRLYGKYYG